jgi:8-oxo-dGTP pyrophosphatase MutT (NUDIX family)
MLIRELKMIVILDLSGTSKRGAPSAGMAKNKAKGDTQYAALPWRIGAGGKHEVMLLTSRETRRWVIPKGWPMKGKKPAQAAAREAYEEAGLIGEIVGKRPIGSYHYSKSTKQGDILCEVQVYLLRVEKQLEDWPEKRERMTAWFDAAKASEFVDERALGLIIGGFARGSLLDAWL